MRLLYPYSYVKKLLKKIADNETEVTDLAITEISTAAEIVRLLCQAYY